MPGENETWVGMPDFEQDMTRILIWQTKTYILKIKEKMVKSGLGHLVTQKCGKPIAPTTKRYILRPRPDGEGFLLKEWDL